MIKANDPHLPMDDIDRSGFSGNVYKVLYRIAERATLGESLYDFTAALHRSVAELMPARNLYICLLGPGGDTIDFPYYVDERDGDAMQEVGVPMRRGLTEFVLRTQKPELIDQPRYQTLFAEGEVTEASGDLTFSSWMGVPLHIRGEIAGVLTLQSYDPQVVYTREHLRLLSFVARHVSALLEKKQAYDALRQAHAALEAETLQRRQSEALYRVFYQLAESANEPGTLHDFGAKVHELVRQLMYAPNCYISLVDMDKGVKHFPYYVDERDGDSLQQMDVPVRRGLTEFVVTSGRAQRIDQPRLRTLERDGLVDQAQGDLSFTGWLGVPLSVRGSVDGVLAVQSYDNGVTYSAADEDLLVHVAHHVSSAIERKQAYEALRRSSSELEAMLNTALVGISYNVGERIVWVNDKCAEMAGLTREQLMGQSPRIFYLTEDDYLTQRARARAALSVTGTHVEERQTRNVHGEPSWVLISGRCVEGTDPDAGVIWTLLDVTDRRKAEEDIRQTLERQRELNALRSRFVAMTSHEFRTPLASILSSAELLHHYSHRMDAGEQAGLLTSIEAAVKRMTKMLDRILLIGRAEAEMLEFKPQPLELPPLLQRLVAEAQIQHPQARSPVELDCADAPSQVVCDETLLRHILGNLLSNALKYSPNGTPVVLRVRLEDATLVAEVQDQGIGIPASEVADMFQSFHRASNVGTIEGTGLGLAIVKKSVDLHGGHIAVDSAEGRGSCFTVRLPQWSAVVEGGVGSVFAPAPPVP